MFFGVFFDGIFDGFGEAGFGEICAEDFVVGVFEVVAVEVVAGDVGDLSAGGLVGLGLAAVVDGVVDFAVFGFDFDDVVVIIFGFWSWIFLQFPLQLIARTLRRFHINRLQNRIPRWNKIRLRKYLTFLLLEDSCWTSLHPVYKM